jgi:hypothetical protein
MRLRMVVLVPLAALMGAGVVVFPALAASEAPKQLEVNENCDAYTDWPCWTAPGTPTYNRQVTVAAGGTIAFVDKSTTPADIVWKTTVPTCSGVPMTKAESNWEGSCKFETAGTYRFESSTLYPTYREYEVVVGGGGSTGITPTGTGTTTGSTTPTGTGTSGSSTTPSSTQSTVSQTGVPAPLGSLFVGSPATACKLPSTQHGQTVHGSVDVGAGGAGGRLEVQVFASRAALASAGHASHVEVGRIVRSGLHAGSASFTIALSSKARHALRSRGHLALSVEVVLSSPQGMSQTVTRSVLVRS